MTKYQEFDPVRELRDQLHLLERRHFLADSGLSTAITAAGEPRDRVDVLGLEVQRVRDLLGAYADPR